MKTTLSLILAGLSLGMACAAPSVTTEWIGSEGVFTAAEAWNASNWQNGSVPNRPSGSGSGVSVTFDNAGNLQLGSENDKVALSTSDDGSITVTGNSQVTIYTNNQWQGNLTVGAGSSLTFGSGQSISLKDGTYHIDGTLATGWDLKFASDGPTIQTFNLGLTGRVTSNAKIYRGARTFVLEGSLNTCCTAATPVSHLTLETRVLFEGKSDTNGSGLNSFGDLSDWLASSSFTDLNGQVLELNTTLNWADPEALTSDYIGKYNLSISADGNSIIATYAIPEPATASLWLFGLAAFSLRRRR